METLKPKVERNFTQLLLGKKTREKNGAKDYMSTQYAKICPFCEGFIDFYSEDCPYCGTQMEKNEVKEQIPPLYKIKNEEPVVVLQPSKGAKGSCYPIIVGGVLGPLSLCLWLIGGPQGVAITIQTDWMPWIFLSSFSLLVFGMIKGETSDS